MKKRLISLLLAFSMMLTFLPAGAVSAFAEESTLTYDCGESVTATLSPNSDGAETYTLTIKGNGPMENYDGYRTSSNNSCAPWCEKIQNITRLIVEDGVTTLGDDILYYSYYDNGSDFHSFHPNLREVKLPEGLSYIGARAFCDSPDLTEVKIPNTVTKIKEYAFSGCTGLTEIELPPQLEEVDGGLFSRCSELKEITIPSSVKTIGARAFQYCTKLESVTLSEGLREIEYQAFYCTNLKSLNIPKSVERLEYDMVGGCQHLAYITIEPQSQLKETEPDYWFGGVFGDGNADVYCEPRLRNLVDNVLERARFITTVDVTLVDGDKSEPKKIDYGANIAALGTPTKQGYSFTGWYTDADCKTRYPDAQLFTNINGITLYAGWKFDPDALVCHPLTVIGGTVTVKYDGSDVTNTLTVTPDEATGKKTYDVPEGAEVTVTLDKALIPAGNVFDGWSTTGNLSLLTGQDYKAESITFTMSSGVDIAAQYRDAATVTIEGLENAVIKEGESKDFTVKVTPNDDAKLGEAFIDFGDKNSEIEYKDKESGEYKPMPEGGLKIGLGDGEVEREFRITPKETGKQTLTAAVKQGEKELARDEKDFVVSEMPILTLKDGVITSVTVPGKNGADPEDITEIVKKNANEDGSFHVPEGATVSVAFDKDAFADSGLKFGHWDITGLDDPNAYQDKESFAFVMPAKAVTLKAMTQDASIEDDEPDIVGPIVIGTTVVVGGAVLGYQAYSLGAEFAGKLMALPYFPSNRSALAMMLWEDAGKPMPESELLYPDVGQEERDMDLQHAARWAMENELIPDLNDEGTAPEEMKFYPDNTVSKIDVLNAWQKAQELKQNA